MKIKNYFYGECKNGAMLLDDEPKFLEHLLNLDKEKIQVLVERRKKYRSLKQNAYYFGVVIEILSDTFGYTPDEMHEALKYHFLTVNRNKLPYIRSTTGLNTLEFEKYLEDIRRWASVEYAISIPTPNEIEIE